jgi:hypothetical protein
MTSSQTRWVDEPAAKKSGGRKFAGGVKEAIESARVNGWAHVEQACKGVGAL